MEIQPLQPEDTVRLEAQRAWVRGHYAPGSKNEHGRDPAVVLEGASIRLFPLTMISKRVERGEEVDVHDLFAFCCAQVEELRDA